MELDNNLYPIDEALNEAEQTIRISLVNQANGDRYEDVHVGLARTLGEVLQEHAGRIGIHPGKKCQFVNKRTQTATSDSAMTVNELGLCDGDVLGVAGDGGVA